MKNKFLLTRSLYALIAGLFFGSFVQKGVCQAPAGYQLIWNDEFNGTVIDPTNWGYDVGGSGWGNNELQYYTNRPENAYLSNGHLVIEARQEKFEKNDYTSARLLTKGKREFMFGRIDIRAKLPYGQGIWPALWSLGKNIDQVGWPACGELDIMELLGHEPNKTYSTVHWGPPGGGSTNLSRSYTLPSGDFSQDFHVFSMVWEPDLIKFYVDDILFSTVTRANISGNYPFNNPFFLIFNVAVGGNWPGNPDGTTSLPQRMYVDYVRVYQETSTLAAPTVAAPTPTPSPSNVISLFSNAYTNAAVDTWSAPWDIADVEEVSIAGNATKKYSNLTYAGVEFHTPGPVIDASSMVRFHADVWTPDATTFKLKLVDFGANGAYGGNDDTEHELSFAPTLGNWYSIDVPLSDFAGMTSRSHVAQLVLVGEGGNKTVWVDNVFFYKLPPVQPTAAAPTPTQLAPDVISLFSNAYTNAAVDTWSAPWDVADVEDVAIAGNATKKYSNLTYAGVEFHTPGPVVNAATMERFHADVWTADATTFKLKLVDFGANGVYDGGDDTEHELSFAPTLGNWFSIDVPLSDFAGMTSRNHVAQLILVGEGGGKTVWVDNVYFYKSPAVVSEPTTAAPTPTQLPPNVISLFSNAYTNAAVDTWSAPWDVADVEDVAIAGNATKKYSNLTFAGIEFHTPGPVVNASAMERFHADIWTANAAGFKLKLVDFGANGVYAGGDDTEHELSFSPTLGSWYSIDVPLSDFAGMTSRNHVAQLILVGEGGGKTVWVDNVYFYKSPAVVSEPTTAAPTPTQLPPNVISLFSNAYTNAAVDTWSAPWDVADVEDVAIAGNATKKYSNLTFAGVEFHTPGPVVNASTMERFHADIWTANAAGFKLKLVDFGANGVYAGGDDTEHELSFSPTLGNWYSIDVPLSDFVGMTSRNHVAQLILVGEGGGKTVWVDNVYFYRAPPLLSASVSGTKTVCLNDVTPKITFTGSNGTAPYTFVYQLNGGASQTLVTASGNTAAVNVPTNASGVFTYSLVSVSDATNRSQNITNSATVTVLSQTDIPTPTVSVSQSMVCMGTTVTVSANCPAGSVAFWNTGVNENSFQVAFNNVTQQTFRAKCIFSGGCQSAESTPKTVRWEAFDLTFINIGQSKSAIKSSDSRSEWANQLITPDGGPSLQESTQSNPTLYFAENVNKMAPRFWTIQVETCALGTDGSVTYDLLATPEFGVVRSYNTHENNAPYFMYANRNGYTELYAQNHPAYGFLLDNGAGGNVYDEGLPKGLYKLAIRYWSQKGQGSIYPATRKAAGNVLAYQEYWFRIQSSAGIGAGSARVATDNGQRITDNGAFAQVMPNPVSSVMHLKVNDSKGQKVNVNLLDASGRMLQQRSFVPESNTHQEEFEVSQLSNGMYFLRVNTPDKQATLKVVKVSQ